MELFILDEVDYTNHIVVPSYSVQQQPVTETWEDATYTQHIEIKRYRLQGSFKIFFETIDELNDFLDKLENMRDPIDNYTPAILYDNYSRTKKSSKFYFKLTLINDKPYYGIKKHDGYDIQVEEK